MTCPGRAGRLLLPAWPAAPFPSWCCLARQPSSTSPREGRSISIRDPWYPPASLSPAFDAVLDLAFSDITEAGTDVDVIFGADHAVEIIRFVSRFAELDRIVVHCHVGASRSPGVALGLCDHFAWPAEELEQSYPAWNRLVRQVLAAQRNPEL